MVPPAFGEIGSPPQAFFGAKVTRFERVVGRRFLARPWMMLALAGSFQTLVAVAVAAGTRPFDWPDVLFLVALMEGLIGAVTLIMVWNLTVVVDESGFRRGLVRGRRIPWSDVESLRGDLTQRAIMALCSTGETVTVVGVPVLRPLAQFGIISDRGDERCERILEREVARLREAAHLH